MLYVAADLPGQLGREKRMMPGTAVAGDGCRPDQPVRGRLYMKMLIEGETLRISEVKELGAANSTNFREQARAALTDEQRNIEIDLSQTMFLDSYGLGSLISLHKTTCSRNGTVRLLNPTPGVQQILELTRMHRLFEITRV
jgi:anti-sigma B factor antagonist